MKWPGYVNYLSAAPKSLDREVTRSAEGRAESVGDSSPPELSTQAKADIDLERIAGLQNSPASTRIRAVHHSHNLFAMEAR